MPPAGHVRAKAARLSPRHERWVLGISFALLVSGALWLAFHYFLPVEGDFGEGRHPLESWWLRLHGAAAMAFLVVLGTLLPVHIDRAWRSRNIHRTGVTMLGVVTALVLTGYGLYYVAGEELRPWMSAIHWGIGLIAVPALMLHVLVSKSKTSSAKPTGHRQARKLARGRTAAARPVDDGSRT